MAQTQARSQAVANYTDATKATLERTRAFSQELDAFSPQLEQVLPNNVTVDRFKRVLITAVATNPDLLYADRRTLYNSSLKAAADGLLPDGKEAALVIYNTDVKLRNPTTGLDEKFTIAAASYIPMIAGVKKRMRNSGEVLSVQAEVVCEKDQFAYGRGDDPYIRHEPPPLGTDRGEIIGAYAIIKLRNGEVIRDVMDRRRIEVARRQSSEKYGMMWTKFYDEACCKTVLKHAAKDAPQSAELVRLLDRDEEGPVIDGVPGISLPAPESQPAQREPEPPPPLVEHHQPEPEPEYAIVTLDGEELTFHTVDATVAAFRALFEEAAKRGLDSLVGAAESNAAALGALDETHRSELEAEYVRLRDALRARQDAPKDPSHPTPAPEAEQRTTAPPDAPAAEPAPKEKAAISTEPSPGPSATGDRPFPGDLPPQEGSPSDDSPGGFFLEPVKRPNGREDWRAWSVGLFVPKLRRITDSTDMALMLGDNEDNLKKARVALHADDRKTLDEAIEAKWKELG